MRVARGARLVHGGAYGEERRDLEERLADCSGQRLDQENRAGLHDLTHDPAGGDVVDRRREIVARDGLVGVEPQRHVDHERLRGQGLLCVHTVGARTPHAPRLASQVVIATDASSRANGPPDATESSIPLRDAPHSTGRPMPWMASTPRSTSQLWSGVLANPSPGSSTSRSGSMPATTAALTRPMSSLTTSATTSSYVARSTIVALWPRQCIATYTQASPATVDSMSGSARPPETSLTTTAPASTHRAATSARIVSTDTATPAAASCVTTGRSRASSVSASTRTAPGRVDSPPTSTSVAPSAAS